MISSRLEGLNQILNAHLSALRSLEHQRNTQEQLNKIGVSFPESTPGVTVTVVKDKKTPIPKTGDEAWLSENIQQVLKRMLAVLKEEK